MSGDRPALDTDSEVPPVVAIALALCNARHPVGTPPVCSDCHRDAGALLAGGAEPDTEERRAAAARAEVWSILTRSQRVDEWPEDERRLHRRGDWRSFSDRNAAVLSLRVDKIMAAALPVSPVQPGAPDELRQEAMIAVHRLMGGPSLPMQAPGGCECPDVASSPAYHGGNDDRCPREPADHGTVRTSPALCLPCLHGCDVAAGTDTTETT
jgi:hypothetical protein